MGTKYPGVSASGYNSSPPSDDGSQTEANKVKWSTIKTKITDPLKTFMEAVDAALTAAFNYGPNSQATNYTVVVGDHDKTIEVTAAATITMIAAATGGAGFTVRVSNQHSAAITVARQGSDVFNAAGTSWSVPPAASVTFVVKAAANGFLVVDQTLSYGATTEILVGGGASALPVWTPATGTGAPVRATSPQFTQYVGIGQAADATYPLAITQANNNYVKFTASSSRVWRLGATGANAAAGMFSLIDDSAGATRINVEPTGEVGIGNTVAAAINSGTGNAWSDLCVGTGSGPTGITIYGASGETSALAFARATSGGGSYAAYVFYSHASDTMAFGTNATTNATLGPTGNFNVVGALSKGSGSFRIEHPLPALSATHELVHSFIEGPQADLIYRGVAVLVNGKAKVNIDEAATMTEGTFEVLCRNVQCFTSNETDWSQVRGSVAGNILSIECQDPASTASISWMVVGERKDKHMLDTEWTDDEGRVIVEPLKPAPEPTIADMADKTKAEREVQAADLKVE